MRKKSQGREALALIITVARLGLAVGLCWSVARQAAPIESVAWLVTIMLGDQLDGVIARRLGVDNAARRVADAVIDRGSIVSAMTVLMIVEPGAFWLFLPVIIREFAVILWSITILLWKRTILTAGKAGVMSCAFLYVAVLFSTEGPVRWLAAVVWLLVWFLLIQYIRAGTMIPVRSKSQPLVRVRVPRLSLWRSLGSEANL